MLLTVLMCTCFMAMIDGVFCLYTHVVYKCKMLSVVTLEWSGIIGTSNRLFGESYQINYYFMTARRSSWVMK